MKFEFVVDTREKTTDSFNPQEHAIKKYPETVIEALHSGDYAARIDGELIVGCERKTIEDFVLSLQSKRIFSQVDKLHKDYKVIILILEGNLTGLYVKMARMKLHFNEEVFWGSYASLVVRDNLHVIWTQTPEQTQNIAYKICKKIAEGKYQIPRKWKPKNLNTPKDLLEAIPGVTEILSTTLLREFKNIATIAHASEKELCSVKGVGPRVAKKIKDYLS